MKRETKDFPEIGILERYFRWKKPQEGNFLEMTRSSPEITFFPGNFFWVTYLARNSWIPKGKRLALANPDSFPDTPEGALSEALSCLNSSFSNPVEFSSWEELDLFLSSRGFEMTERSEFLSLVERFLSWQSYPGTECRNVSLYEKYGLTFVTYDMINSGGSSKRAMSSGSRLEDCASNSISYMCRCTGTSGKEELDLFLSSRGF